jgi:hypothetical protein
MLNKKPKTMKKSTFFVALISTLLLLSCNKTSLNEPELTNNPNSSNQSKGGGLIEDDPKLYKHFELRVSKDFLEKGRTVAYVGGKKIHDLSIEEAEALMTAQAKGTKGNAWGGTKGGSSGGSTGGGGTTTITDWTPPIISGLDPVNGRTYTLNQDGNYPFYTSAFLKDETLLTRVQIRIRGVVMLDTALSVANQYISIGKYYGWIFGDGAYDIVWQAWDAAGNTTQSTKVIYRNSTPTPLPENFPSAHILAYPQLDKYINQGGEGSCAAFAVANAFTIQRYARNGGTGGFNDNNVSSPEWIYNASIRTNSTDPQVCFWGSSIIGNYGIVINRGAANWTSLPYTAYNCDTLMFSDAIRTNAAQNKGIWGFKAMTVDRNAIKYNIYKGYAAAFGMATDVNFHNAGPGYIWMGPYVPGTGNSHALVLIGYDDSKNAYLCLNSWGTRWGGNGTIWIDYDFFENGVKAELYYLENY